MKKLLAPAIIATDVNGKNRIFEMPNSTIFWVDGEQISIEEAIESLSKRNSNVKFNQITLGEYFEYHVKTWLSITPHTFKDEEEKFNYWLRVILGCEFEVDEKTYKKWYENINRGIETVYL